VQLVGFTHPLRAISIIDEFFIQTDFNIGVWMMLWRR